jgi:hypothetical protein
VVGDPGFHRRCHAERLMHAPEIVEHKVERHHCCELRFNGESYSWEAQFIEDDGFLFYAHGGFVTRALAVQSAEEERKAMESGT